MLPSKRLVSFGLVLLFVGAALPAAANVTVILRSGGRIEAASALETPTGWVVKLPGGGTLALSPQSVRRVSHAAADLPSRRSVEIATSSPAIGRTSVESSTDAEPRQVARYTPTSENLLLPRSASLLAQGAPGEAPRGILPTPEESAARQARQRASATNPLTGVIQRYTPGAAGAAARSLRDPEAEGGMHRAFGRPIR